MLWINPIHLVKVVKVQGPVPILGPAQHILEAVVPENFVGHKGMAGMNGLGEIFVDAGDNHDDFCVLPA
jgi:hypothetical protein